MYSLIHMVDASLIETIGWGLVHFAWQGALLALLLAGVLRALRSSTPHARYVAATGVLALMAACLPVTVVWQLQGSAASQASVRSERNRSEQSPNEAERSIATVAQPIDGSVMTSLPEPRETTAAPAPRSNPHRTSATSTPSIFDRVRRTVSASLSWLVGAWIIGVTLMWSRLCLAWVRIQRFRRQSHQPAAANWQAALARVSRRLGVAYPVQLIETALVEVPAVIGWLRPVVFLPASALTGLAPSQIEALLAHEVAHIRRHDYLVNLLQNGVETLLFYHPAVWWVSAYIRQTREHCCDDVAAAVCGSAIDYARTLAILEERRQAPAILSVAANGGSLFERIRRLVGQPEPVRAQHAVPAVLFSLSLFVACSLYAVNARSAGEQTNTRELSPNIAVDRSKFVVPAAVPGADNLESAITAVGAPDEAPKRKDKPDDKPAAEVTGTLVSADDQPIVEFKIEAVRQTGQPETTFVTDEKGEFRVPETWFRDPEFAGEIFVCIARDTAGGLGWFQIPSSGAQAGNIGDAKERRPMPFRFAVLPSERTVTGRILDPDQKPLAGIRIQVQRMQHPLNGDVFLYGFGMTNELPLPSVMTDEAGRFELKLPKNVQIMLHALHPEWVVRYLSAIERDDLGDVVMVPAGRIAGKVVFAENGQPAPGILISANRQNSARNRAMQRNRTKEDPDANLGVDGFSITDAEGKYEIGGLKADSHDMYAHAGPDHGDLLGPHLQGIDVRTSETTTVDMTVQKGRRVAGRVIEADSGKPISGRGVYVYVFRDREHRSLISMKYPKTNERGEFESYVLPGFGQAKVEASREESLKQTPESTREFEVADRGLVPPVVLKLRAPTPAEMRRLQLNSTKYLQTRPESIGGFAFDGQGETLVTAGWLNADDDREAWVQGTTRGDLRFWDAKSGAQIARCEGEFGGLFDVAISPDGIAMATAGRVLNSANGGELRIWDLKTQQLRAVLEGHTGWVLAVAYSPGGGSLVSGSFDKTARVWDTATGQELKALVQTSTPNYLHFSPDGGTLVVGCRGGSIKLYDAMTWKERMALDVNNSFLFDVELSPDGKLLAAAGATYEADGKTIKSDKPSFIRIWDVATGTERRSWQVEHQPSSIVFSPDGRHLASARHTSSVWDVESGEELAVIHRSVSSSGDQIRYSPDGKSLVIGGHQGVQFWDVSPLLPADGKSK